MIDAGRDRVGNAEGQNAKRKNKESRRGTSCHMGKKLR